MNRRQAIGLGGALGGVGLLGWLNLRRNRLWEWRGTVMGTEGSVLFHSRSEKDARFVMNAVNQEAARLEAVFSLENASSTIRHLNQNGQLKNPPFEFVEALKLCGEVHEMTDGAFDPTVQPLWEVYDAHFGNRQGESEPPPPNLVDEALAKVDFRAVEFSDDSVSFTKSGMSLTLNGMAQGFISEKIARFILGLGVTHALVNLGEYCALGPPRGNDGWKVAIESSRTSEEFFDTLSLVYGGLATSGGYGYRFDQSGKFHHLFNPRGEAPPNVNRVVVVEAPDAGLADALSTAGAVMSWKRFRRLQLPMLGLRFHEYGCEP
ncbi:MAG: FAD:protein FMN transferase [Verrucomicrobiota bacterium]